MTKFTSCWEVLAVHVYNCLCKLVGYCSYWVNYDYQCMNDIYPHYFYQKQIRTEKCKTSLHSITQRVHYNILNRFYLEALQIGSSEVQLIALYLVTTGAFHPDGGLTWKLELNPDSTVTLCIFPVPGMYTPDFDCTEGPGWRAAACRVWGTTSAQSQRTAAAAGAAGQTAAALHRQPVTGRVPQTTGVCVLVCVYLSALFSFNPDILVF